MTTRIFSDNKILLTCHRVIPSLQGDNDVMNLASTLAGNFMGIVQYNRDNRAFEVRHVIIISFMLLISLGSYQYCYH